MPTYEYRCRRCGSTFAMRRPMQESSEPATCPDGHSDTVKLISAFAAARSGGADAAGPSGGGCCGGACGCG